MTRFIVALAIVWFVGTLVVFAHDAELLRKCAEQHSTDTCYATLN